ncbi:MAG TPA: UDP-N-acetylglucosamine 1-carboxyvinyltransferase, partial [Pirellulales bacterium]
QRGIDLHLHGLAALGASIHIENGYVIAEANALRGAEMDLSGPRGPTVTGTANVIMAAVLARGETIIRSAAREPEIIDLGEFLISIGARIEGLGGSTIRIRGVTQLGVTQLGGTGKHGYRVITDRMEAGTLLLAACMTGGEVTVESCQPNHLDSVLAVLDDAGAHISTGRNWIRAAAPWRPLSFHLTALPYPGVPTDLQPLFTALASVADGQSTIADYVFPQRFAHLEQLTRMGANIQRRGQTATINGVDRLISRHVVASDLRAAAALVLAGLATHGQTTIGAAHHLHRGYENLIGKLSAIGADIGLTKKEAHNTQRAGLQFEQTFSRMSA